MFVTTWRTVLEDIGAGDICTDLCRGLSQRTQHARTTVRGVVPWYRPVYTSTHNVPHHRRPFLATEDARAWSVIPGSGGVADGAPEDEYGSQLST